MKYSVTKGNGEEFILKKNGFQSFCPFSQPFPMPSANNEVNLMRVPCSTQCPHATYDEDYWSITCAGGVKQVFHIEPEKNKFDLKVI
jgi:hypothetical protein